MSRRFFQSFFPGHVTLIERSPLLSFVHDYVVFPTDVADQCPEVVLFGVRNVSLLIAAIAGVIVGGTGSLSVNCVDIFWRVSFLAFGCMNAVCIFLHSVLHNEETAIYPQSSRPILRALWILDQLFTGISSTSVVFAVLTPFWKMKRKIIIRIYCVSVISLSGLAVLAYAWTENTLLLELWYLLPTVTAALTVWMSPRRDSRIVMAAIVILMGLVIDAPSCRILGATPSDPLRAPTLLFVGCDIAFWSLHINKQKKKLS